MFARGILYVRTLTNLMRLYLSSDAFKENILPGVIIENCRSSQYKIRFANVFTFVKVNNFLSAVLCTMEASQFFFLCRK